jgi:ribosomal protein L11 methyltransferase
MTDTTVWQADCILPLTEATGVEARLDDLPDFLDQGVYSQFEESADRIRFEIYVTGEPSPALVAALQEAMGTALAFAPVADEDWVTRSNHAVEPFWAGRFHIVPPHAAGEWSPYRIIIPAGLAFGTGHHETTRGCLLLIEEVLSRRPVRHAIDVGCGTGILAMALAKAGLEDVTATDNDPIAITVTRENMELNGLPAAAMTTLVAEGFQHEALEGKQYDLIVANILAGPLIALAPDMARHAAPGAEIILSGLLTSQEKEVLAAYAKMGFARRQHFRSGEWSALLLNS